ncbi:hypothetical protein H6P81_011335 [Aristolochia fimbriata]|uniref:Uncharacterized protein n=1 Tax=Aristolochia fimbriata TaxID=158543 RepID=A0AAV7ER69_ARIFI|nr:hypothetical protein H6P81_011335 [Aristolochia fimbriata]
MESSGLDLGQTQERIYFDAVEGFAFCGRSRGGSHDEQALTLPRFYQLNSSNISRSFALASHFRVPIWKPRERRSRDFLQNNNIIGLVQADLKGGGTRKPPLMTKPGAEQLGDDLKTSENGRGLVIAGGVARFRWLRTVRRRGGGDK